VAKSEGRKKSGTLIKKTCVHSLTVWLRRLNAGRRGQGTVAGEKKRDPRRGQKIHSYWEREMRKGEGDLSSFEYSKYTFTYRLQTKTPPNTPNTKKNKTKKKPNPKKKKKEKNPTNGSLLGAQPF